MLKRQICTYRCEYCEIKSNDGKIEIKSQKKIQSNLTIFSCSIKISEGKIVKKERCELK